jgi:YidC/Oxa1 family membrane protein insertase
MDNTRLFLYAALAFVSLLIWEQWNIDYGPQPAAVEQTRSEAPVSADGNTRVADAGDLPSVEASAAPPQAAADPAADAVLIRVETDVVEAVIDSRGGVIRSLKLKQYPVDVDHPDQYLELLFQRPDELHVLQNGLRSANSPAPTHYDVYESPQTEYRLAEGSDELRVPLRWQKDGIEVVKTYVFHRGDYLVNLEHRLNNNSASEWQGSEYRQITRSRPLETSRLLYTYTGAVVYNDEIKYEKVNFDDMEEEPLRLESTGGWIAMLQHYFLSAIVARPDEKILFYTLANTRQFPKTYTVGMKSATRSVAPGQSVEFDSELFVGPKLVDRLEAIAPGLELTVDYGVLTFLSKPMAWYLTWLHNLIGNWGLAIILLTLTVKLLFFKLSEASYKSMARMRKLTPRLKALKERYGDDRQRMNQAMMDLYKEEKVNPMGGCLPMVVQIPIFIALYWSLLENVELRQATFLWINDLSAMDPYYILPILMGVSMLIQQKLNPAPTDPMQAKVMMILPLVFSVFFAFFPAGLVLYWVVNNVLSIAQQWIITRRIESGEEK